MPRVPLWRLRDLLHWRCRTRFHRPLLILCNCLDDLLTPSGSGDLSVAGPLGTEARGRPCPAASPAAIPAPRRRGSPAASPSGSPRAGRAAPARLQGRNGAVSLPAPCGTRGQPALLPLPSAQPRAGARAAAAPAMVRCGAAALRKVSAPGAGPVGTVPQAALGWRGALAGSAGGERRSRSRGLCGSSRVPGGSRCRPVLPVSARRPSGPARGR